MPVQTGPNRARLPVAAWFGVLLAGLLSGCFGGGKQACDKRQEYQAGGSVEALRVPASLDRPNRSATLVIPDASPNARRRERGEPCLETPPDYFERDVAERAAAD